MVCISISGAFPAYIIIIVNIHHGAVYRFLVFIIKNNNDTQPVWQVHFQRNLQKRACSMLTYFPTGWEAYTTLGKDSPSWSPSSCESLARVNQESVAAFVWYSNQNGIIICTFSLVLLLFSWLSATTQEYNYYIFFISFFNRKSRAKFFCVSFLKSTPHNTCILYSHYNIIILLWKDKKQEIIIIL